MVERQSDPSKRELPQGSNRKHTTQVVWGFTKDHTGKVYKSMIEMCEA